MTGDYDYYNAETGEGLTEWELLERFNEALDDSWGTVEVAGMTFDTSRVLAECDPIAHRCDFLDYVDSLMKDGEITEEPPTGEGE